VVYSIDSQAEIYMSHGRTWYRKVYYRSIRQSFTRYMEVGYNCFTYGADRIKQRILNRREPSVFTSGWWLPARSAGKAETYTKKNSVRRSAGELEQKLYWHTMYSAPVLGTRQRVAAWCGEGRSRGLVARQQCRASVREEERPGISVSLERFWELSREYLYSWDREFPCLLSGFWKRAGNIRARGNSGRDRESPCLWNGFWKRAGNIRARGNSERDRESPCLLIGVWRRAGNIRARGNSERDRESPCLLVGFWKRAGNIRVRGNSERTRISCP